MKMTLLNQKDDNISFTFYYSPRTYRFVKGSGSAFLFYISIDKTIVNDHHYIEFPNSDCTVFALSEYHHRIKPIIYHKCIGEITINNFHKDSF